MKKNKRIFAMVLLLCILLPIILLFAGCNKAIGLGSYTFNGIVISVPGNDKHVCLTVVNWHDDDTGIEVKTEEYGPIFCSEGTYILFHDKCPICGKTKGD